MSGIHTRLPDRSEDLLPAAMPDDQGGLLEVIAATSENPARNS